MATRLRERKEAEAQKLELALSALARAKHQEKCRRHLLEQVLTEGGCALVATRILPPSIRNAAVGMRWCQTRQTRELFRELMLHLERHAERLLEAESEWGGHPYLEGLLSLVRQHSFWIRPLAAWKPTTRNPARQFTQLARHLLTRYEVPDFLEAVLHEGEGEVWESWYRHVGQGGSLRTAPGLTVPLTKRMAHHALQAPDTCTVVQALRWGQVIAMGGTPRLAYAVNNSNLGQGMASGERETWRQTVLQWLANQPMLDPAQVVSIVNYALYRHRRDRRFILQGRTPQSIMRLIAEWNERQAARERERARSEERSRYRYREFPVSGISSGIWETGRGSQYSIWTIEEIRCNRDLIVEGREMRHCVATYEESVAAGRSSIWSMKVERAGTVQRATTIEVRPTTRTVVECLGKCNRTASAEERRVLQRWADENGLQVELWDE